MSSIYLIRHAQASFGDKNYDQLSDIGFRQAKILGDHLLLSGRPFDAVYHGTLNRQRQTAETVMARHEKFGRELPAPAVSDAFDEYDAIAVWDAYLPLMTEEDPSLKNEIKQIKTDKKIFQKIFSSVMFRWISGRYDMEGVPRWKDFKASVNEGLHRLMETHGAGSRIAVFTSGGPISLAIQQALDLSDKKTMELSWQVMNTSITHLKYKDGKMALAGFNDIAHLKFTQNEALLTYR